MQPTRVNRLSYGAPFLERELGLAGALPVSETAPAPGKCCGPRPGLTRGTGSGKRVAARLGCEGRRSLFTASWQIDDPRGGQGKRYPLPSLKWLANRSSILYWYRCGAVSTGSSWVCEVGRSSSTRREKGRKRRGVPVRCTGFQPESPLRKTA